MLKRIPRYDPLKKVVDDYKEALPKHVVVFVFSFRLACKPHSGRQKASFAGPLCCVAHSIQLAPIFQEASGEASGFVASLISLWSGGA